MNRPPAPTFTALDFETANHSRQSICQVGLVRVVEGVVVQEVSRLVRPPDNRYFYIHTGIHGITADDTAEAPSFDEVWPEIAPLIVDQRVVAHNGPSFDFDVLRQTLGHYRLPAPSFEGICTYQIYRKNLGTLCAEHGIAFTHHDALSDARACATLYLRACGVTFLRRARV